MGAVDYNLTWGLPWCLRCTLCHPWGKPLIFGQATNPHSLFLTSKLHLQQLSVTLAPWKTRKGSVPTKTWIQTQPLLGYLSRQGKNRGRECEKSCSIPHKALWVNCLQEPSLPCMQIYQANKKVCSHLVFTTYHPLAVACMLSSWMMHKYPHHPLPSSIPGKHLHCRVCVVIIPHPHPPSKKKNSFPP